MVSDICIPQCLDLICTRLDKFLAHGQAHVGGMGKNDNDIVQLQFEAISQNFEGRKLVHRYDNTLQARKSEV